MTREEVIWGVFIHSESRQPNASDLLWGIHTHGTHLTSRGREAQGSC